VTELDAMRLPAFFATHVRQGELATCARPGGIRCVALSGELGVRVACDIHPHRPDACRRFEQGSEECLAARAEVLGLVTQQPGQTR
jgi:Fe-S-cluster containining protein